MKELAKINVIDKVYKSEIKEKGSVFLGYAIPVISDKEIIPNLEKLKKKYYDATHHCYAYKLIDSFKYSDAGEPSGTAGIRIYNAIEHFNMVNILVVVIRYFGGTKLGMGGLGRTYYESAISVLEKSNIIEKFLYQKIIIKVDYHLAQKIYKIYNGSENKIINVKYSDLTIFECLVKPECLTGQKEEIQNISKGKCEFITLGKVYY